MKFGLLAWGGGDPHFQTLDNLEYTFNGYGMFIYMKANDGSFQIQVKTSVVTNEKTQPPLSGTLFTSFALQNNQSQTFQIDIADSTTNTAYLG